MDRESADQERLTFLKRTLKPCSEMLRQNAMEIFAHQVCTYNYWKTVSRCFKCFSLIKKLILAS